MPRRPQIAPSILSADFAALGKDVEMVSQAGASWIHVDVMDGHFVPNLTIGPNHVKALKRVTKVPLDVHLMIDNPLVQVPWYLDAGADLVTVHAEACQDPQPIFDMIHERGVKAGFAINPETDVAVVEPWISTVDLVLVMSVHPGFGGQSFIEESVEKIQEVVRLCAKHAVRPLIEVDGGINTKTALPCITAGVDVLVAGNAIFGAEDPVAALQALRDCND